MGKVNQSPEGHIEIKRALMFPQGKLILKHNGNVIFLPHKNHIGKCDNFQFFRILIVGMVKRVI